MITAHPQTRREQKDGTAVRKPCRGCGCEVLVVAGLVLEVAEVEPPARCSGCDGERWVDPDDGGPRRRCLMCGGSGRKGRAPEAGMVALDAYATARVLGFWEEPVSGEAVHREHRCARERQVAA